MRLGQDVLSDPQHAARIEWLLTDGAGGAAHGNALGIPARREHALLVSSTPNGHATTLLLRFEERLTVDGVHVELAPPAAPARALLAAELEEFHAEPWPTWRFRAGAARIEKSVRLVHGHHAVVIEYHLVDGPQVRLSASPLVVARDPDQLQAESADLARAIQGLPGRVRVEISGARPSLTIWHNGAFLPARVWRRATITVPGADEASESALVPGHIEMALAPGGWLQLVASSEEDLFRALAVEGRLGTPPPRTLAECLIALERGDRERLDGWRRRTLQGADYTARQAAAAHGAGGEITARRRRPLVDEHDAWVSRLGDALRDALIKRGARLTLAPPWPGAAERGSDTLRAVPALISLRAFDEARAVLCGYLENLDEGLAPERFDPGSGAPIAHDPRPSLWLVHAGEVLARRSEDVEFVRHGLYQPLESVMQHYRAGTRNGIRVDADGLLACAASPRGNGAGHAPGGNGDPATERHADVNVLWYHALVAMAQLARLIGRKESGAFYLAWAREHQKVFVERFWNERAGCLLDRLPAEGIAEVPAPKRRARVEPNPAQLLAVALGPPLLGPEMARRLIGTLTPVVLARAGIDGGPASGMPDVEWLGTLIGATLKAHGRSEEAQAQVRGWCEALDARARDLGHVGWTSVAGPADLLRAWIEDVDHADEPAVVA